jgi:tetratricopeptide (TPR) repeat protein
MSEPAKRLLAGAALVLVTLAVHAPRGGDFAYDDNDFVATNQSIRNLAGAVAALALPFPPEQPERGLYRPLTNLSYALDHALWGSNAVGFHLSNALLYTLLVLGVARLSMVYMGSLGFAFSVALLFAVSPVHCEAVDNVAGRSEILALLWSVVSLLCFLRGTHDTRSDRGWLVASAAAYALACASKETGVVLPVVLAVHRLALAPPRPGSGPRGWLSDLRPLAPHAAVLVAYLVLRTVVLGRFSPAASILLDSDLTARLATIGTVYLLNLGLLIWPPLEVDFYYQAVVGLPTHFTALAVLGWMALLASAAAALWLARRHFADAIGEGSRARATALCGVSIFATTLLPTSHLLDVGALAAERFLFAPSLGFLILVVLAVRQLLGVAPASLRPGLGAALLLPVAAMGAWRSHERAAEWRDPQRLWREATRSLPHDERVHTNLAAVLIERGQLGEAREALDIALSLKPGYRAALGNLATVDLEEGRLEEASMTYQRMLELEPDDFLTWYNLGRLELARGRRDVARRHFQRSIEINPNFSHARLGLEATDSR